MRGSRVFSGFSSMVFFTGLAYICPSLLSHMQFLFLFHYFAPVLVHILVFLSLCQSPHLFDAPIFLRGPKLFIYSTRSLCYSNLVLVSSIGLSTCIWGITVSVVMNWRTHVGSDVSHFRRWELGGVSEGEEKGLWFCRQRSDMYAGPEICQVIYREPYLRLRVKSLT